MRALGRLGWLPMPVLAVVLVSILTFLYVRSKGYDASSYFENVALIREMKQLDARWELDVLKSKMGIETNYDSLVDPLVGLNQLWDRLQGVVSNQRDAAHLALVRGKDAYHRAMQEKIRLIEHFKSHNSVLRNSLAFLPTAADDVQKVIKSGGHRPDRLPSARVGAGANLTADVNKTLLDSMVYSQAPSDDKAADIEADLASLTAAGPQRPAVSDAVEIFAAHVRTVLHEQPAVNALLASIAAVPTAERLDDLDNLLSDAKRQAELQAQRDRRDLLIFSAALAALLLYAAVRLIRSRTVINRFNRELQAANETLEHRVQERTSELRAAQSELVTTARQTGMAEIATNVLHNVGNVLNSVNVSAGLIGSRIRESKTKGFADAVQLMNEHAADLGDFMTRDERGKRLPGYLNKLVATLATEKSAVIQELESLTKGVDHIRDIVATQQSYAGVASLSEPVEVSGLLEDALRMNAGSMARRQVTVAKEWSEVPQVLLDKHLMLQILINLIANALQALDSVLDRPHRLTLRADTTGGAEGHGLRIEVEDNGEGIISENLPRLFTHGFTTRKHGHGFGLHSCSLAARAMGGKLTAYSEGRDKGAIFTLDLPLNEVEMKAVANL